MALIWVADTAVVIRGVPFHSIVLPLTKPEPFTVRVKSLPPPETVAGESELATGRGLRLPAEAMLLVKRKSAVAGELGSVTAR